MGAEPRRISQLDLAGPLTSADQLAIVQGTVTKRTTLSSLSSLMEDACECTLASRYNTRSSSALALTYLDSYVMPENTLATDGSWLEIYATGTFAGNNNNKYASVNISSPSTGYSLNFSFPTDTFNTMDWEISIRVQRKTELKARVIGKCIATPQTIGTMTADETFTQKYEDADLDFGNGMYFSVSGFSGTAASGDVTMDSWIIEAHLLDPNS